MKLENGVLVAETPEETTALRAMLDGEVAGLKTKNSELLGKLKTFDGFKDVDPTEYRTLKEKAAKAEEDRALKAGEFENLKSQLLSAHGKEKQALEAKIAMLSKSLEEHVLIATATQAIADEKGAALLLMPHVKSRTKLDENGSPVVVDAEGNVRIGADGKNLTIKQLIAEMKADVTNFGRAFDGIGHSGSGTQNTNAAPVSAFEKMSKTELAHATLNPATKDAANAFIKKKYGG